MYVLRFYHENMPPVLNDGFKDVNVSNYIIGAPNDPHWRIYPKEEFLTARNKYQINWAFTDYVQDNYHYIFYMPENTGPTSSYSMLLRDYFERVHKYRQQARGEEQEKEKQERREKVEQLKGLLMEQTQYLKKFKEELRKLESDRARSIRSMTRSGIPKEMAEVNHDQTNPRYANTIGSIKITEANIITLKNELKSYTD